MPDSEWTIHTLRESTQQQLNDLRALLDERYATQTKALDAAFEAAEKGVVTALASAEKAVTKAETAAERRFASVNEFRSQLADQSASFITRVEFTARLDALDNQVDDLKEHTNQSQGKATGMSSLYGWMIAGAGVIVSAIVMMNVLFGR